MSWLESKIACIQLLLLDLLNTNGYISKKLNQQSQELDIILVKVSNEYYSFLKIIDDSNKDP